jgi:O-antigen/teichoic acid export membrane protein
MTRAERFQQLTTSQGVDDGLKKRSIQGGAFAMTAEGCDFVLRVASIVVLARLLVPEYFGLISMVTVVTSIAERFKDLGLTTATVQRKEITHEQVSTLFWVNSGVGLAMMLIVAAFAYPIALFYNDFRLVPITLAVATSFLWSGMAIQHQALLRRQMKFARIGVIQVGSNALSIVVAISLALKGFGYWALVGREVSRNVFLTLGTWACFPWVPSAPSRQAGVGSMLRFGGHMTAFNLVWFLSAGLDQILIGKIFGPVSLGLYRQGFQLVLAPINQFRYPIQVVGEAALSRLQNDAERYRRYYQKFLSLLSLVTMPLVTFLAVNAEEVVLVALGPRWIAATPMFRIMAIAAFIRPAAATTGVVTITCGHSRRFFWLGLFSSLALVIFFLAGIPWGPAGIASAHIWSVYLYLLPVLYWNFKDTPVTVGLFFSSIAKPVLASLLMGGLLFILKQAAVVHGSLGALGLSAAVALPAYLGVWLVLPGGGSELRRLVADLTSILSPSGLLGKRKKEQPV